METSLIRVTGAEAEPELAWLREGRPADEALTGYDRADWADSTWVLHRMYENLQDDAEQDEGTVGFRSPHDPWERVRWADYLARFPDFRPNRSVPPCFRWFPIDDPSPGALYTPGEGVLNEDDLAALLDLLAPNEDVFAFVAGAPSGDWGSGHLWHGPGRAIPDLMDDRGGPYRYTPSNMWPPDRSWFAWTDYDLEGTRVSGTADLIAAVRDRPELETVEWSPAD